jgi:hypothetical protein
VIVYKFILGGIIINNSVFTRLTPNLVVGLEILSFFDVTAKESFIVFYPQIHVSITATLTVQVSPLPTCFEPESETISTDSTKAFPSRHSLLRHIF